jgi:hypothetical protein
LQDAALGDVPGEVVQALLRVRALLRRVVFELVDRHLQWNSGRRLLYDPDGATALSRCLPAGLRDLVDGLRQPARQLVVEQALLRSFDRRGGRVSECFR